MTKELDRREEISKDRLFRFERMLEIRSFEDRVKVLLLKDLFTERHTHVRVKRL